MNGTSTSQAESSLEPSGENLLDLSLQDRVRVRALPLTKPRNCAWVMMAEQQVLSQYVKLYSFTNHPECDQCAWVYSFLQQTFVECYQVPGSL